MTVTTTVDLTPDQEEIRDVARRFVENEYKIERVRELMATDAGFEDENYSEIAEMGWTGIALSEDLGGAGYGDVERVVLMEELGRGLLPLPFLSSGVLATDALEALAAEGADAAAELLGQVAVGELRATLVAAGGLHAGGEVAGAVTASGDSLSGDGGLVLDAQTANVLLVAATDDDGVGLFRVEPDGDGVTIEPVVLVDDTRKAARVSLDGASATRIDAGSDCEELLRRALDRSTVALAAEQVGAARAALDMTIAYMNERKQFGVAIGTFQALKHRASDMGVGIDAARESVLMAVDALSLDDDPEGATRAVSAAKAAASDIFVHTGSECIQLYGGIGFTQEGDIGLYYKRALLTAAILGTSADHRERLASSLGI